MSKEVIEIFIKQQKSGFDKLSKEELLLLKEYYSKSLPQRRGFR